MRIFLTKFTFFLRKNTLRIYSFNLPYRLEIVDFLLMCQDVFSTAVLYRPQFTVSYKQVTCNFFDLSHRFNLNCYVVRFLQIASICTVYCLGHFLFLPINNDFTQPWIAWHQGGLRQKNFGHANYRGRPWKISLLAYWIGRTPSPITFGHFLA